MRWLAFGLGRGGRNWVGDWEDQRSGSKPEESQLRVRDAMHLVLFATTRPGSISGVGQAIGGVVEEVPKKGLPADDHNSRVQVKER